MKEITITLPDGTARVYPEGVTGARIAASIGPALAAKALSIQVDGETCDLSRPIVRNAAIQLFTWNDEEGKRTFWHSSAHLLAEALEALYPGIKFGIGPPIDRGFYYDVDFGDAVFGEEDLPKVEQKMKELAKKNSRFVRKPVSKEEALSYFEKKGDEYKCELIQELEDGAITFYRQGNFVDLCKGPHIPSTGAIKAIKLLNVAGAYWRGDEKKKMLTRIYGASFPKQKELTEYLALLEEAKKRDHRKLGKALGLFAFSENVGAGLPLWLPKGAVLRDCLERFMRDAQEKRGYQPVITPHIGSKQLYVTSGHYEKYGMDSFRPMKTPDEGELFMLKPMNCPHHCEIYKATPHSYRELPIRLAEFGSVYRYEQSGELHGLTRVRGFTQDDAHIFCRPDQIKDEFMQIIDLVLYVFNALGFVEYTAQLSLRDPADKDKYIGDDALWERAEREIQEATQEKKLDTVTVKGEAAFYGPKLDFMVKDALGRQWQLGTIQIDYQLPQRFELTYTGADNRKHTPVMIHRAPFGSMERFIAILTEHCSGNFPLWLAPEQVAVLPISTKFNDYARQTYQALKARAVRATLDERDEKIGRKIRDAETQKIPFMLVVGEREVADNQVAVRRHREGDQGSMALADFLVRLEKDHTAKPRQELFAAAKGA